jgi:hypothetical protein
VMVSTADGRDAPATIAVTLTDPRIVAARAVLGPGDQPPVLSGADLSLGYQREFTNVAPGAYRLTFVCVGTGRLQIRTWLGVNPPPTQELPCSQDGERLEFDVASSTVDTFVMAVLEIGGPPGVSGFAFRLDRAPALDPGPAA